MTDAGRYLRRWIGIGIAWAAITVAALAWTLFGGMAVGTRYPATPVSGYSPPEPYTAGAEPTTEMAAPQPGFGDPEPTRYPSPSTTDAGHPMRALEYLRVPSLARGIATVIETGDGCGYRDLTWWRITQDAGNPGSADITGQVCFDATTGAAMMQPACDIAASTYGTGNCALYREATWPQDQYQVATVDAMCLPVNRGDRIDQSCLNRPR